MGMPSGFWNGWRASRRAGVSYSASGLSNHVMDVLEILVKPSYARNKTGLLIQAYEGIEMTRCLRLS